MGVTSHIAYLPSGCDHGTQGGDSNCNEQHIRVELQHRFRVDYMDALIWSVQPVRPTVWKFNKTKQKLSFWKNIESIG